jgi:hypothetical protein
MSAMTGIEIDDSAGSADAFGDFRGNTDVLIEPPLW